MRRRPASPAKQLVHLAAFLAATAIVAALYFGVIRLPAILTGGDGLGGGPASRTTQATTPVTEPGPAPESSSPGPPPVGVTSAPPVGAERPTPGQRCQPASLDGIPPQPGKLEPLPDKAVAQAALGTLPVVPRAGGDTYCRGRFGPDTWPDLDGNTCSTRQDVLVRQAQQVTTRKIASHPGNCQEAISGTWIDPYTGLTLTFTNLKDPGQAARIQIDHLVPLYNAWVSGAWRWTDAQRVIFAADLAAPELYAVAGEVNFAKNHNGAESWSPVPERQCDYGRSYVAVKAKYALTVTERERGALAAMLATCPG